MTTKMRSGSMMLFITAAMVLISLGRCHEFNEIPADLLLHENITEGAIIRDTELVADRYNGTQMWRISKSHGAFTAKPIIASIIGKFGGNVWKEHARYHDVSIDANAVDEARQFLNANGIEMEVLNANIQDSIDGSQMLSDGAKSSSLRHYKSSRFKRAIPNQSYWKAYHRLDNIFDFMQKICGDHSKICELSKISKNGDPQQIVARISETPHDRNTIWIDGGIHAREWISPAATTFIMNDLLKHWYDSDNRYRRGMTWYIMPVMNPDGYIYSYSRERMWRKNRGRSESDCIGVDLNRNFNISWDGEGSSPDPCSNIYRGKSPESEPETQNVCNFLRSIRANLTAYITFHSYGQYITYPWAYRRDTVENAEELHQVAASAATSIRRATGRHYAVGPTYKLLGVAGGGSDDWAKEVLNARYVYTVELRDRGERGFALPPEQIEDTSKEGLIIVNTVARNIWNNNHV